jgi:subtilisin family serine protease
MAAFGLTDGFEVRVMPVKCYDDEGDEGDDMAKARGMIWAAKHGADVLNMSYSWPEEDNDKYHLLSLKAIDGVYELKVIMCASNGNTGTDQNRYPAFHEYVMGVAGNVQNGGWWPISTYNGRTSCAAPSYDLCAPYSYYQGQTTYWNDAEGTSLACPHIAAACAIVAGSYSAPFPPNYVELVRKRVEGCCDDTNGGGWDKKLGHGRINMKKVVLDVINVSSRDGRGDIGPSALVNDKTSAEYVSSPEPYTEPAVLPTYPNPAAGSVKFGFRLPKSYGNEEVTIAVYDLSGRKVAEPFKDVTGPGEHIVNWECVGYDGSVLAPGVYIYSVVAGDFNAVRRVVISDK